jgi:hypothetical protein
MYAYRRRELLVAWEPPRDGCGVGLLHSIQRSSVSTLAHDARHAAAMSSVCHMTTATPPHRENGLAKLTDDGGFAFLGCKTTIIGERIISFRRHARAS